jgi:adenylate cyclase
MAAAVTWSARVKRLLFRGGGERVAALALLVCLLAARAIDPVPMQILRLKTFDVYQLLSPRIPNDLPVAIVDIDEASLRAHGQWPWSRVLVAQLTTRLGELGAAAIGMDILFAEPDRLSPGRLANELQGMSDEAKNALRALPDNDVLFADTIRQLPVVLAISGLVKANAEEAGIHRLTPVVILGENPAPYLMRLPSRLGNLPALEKASSGLGLVNIVPEVDGVVRRVPALMVIKDEVTPTMAIELLRVALGEKSIAVRTSDGGLSQVILGNNALPVDGNGFVWLNMSRHEPKRYVSARDVLAGNVPSAAIEGKIVLVGTSATGLFDQKPTALDGAIPGVEIHAQFIENMVSDAALSQPSYALGLEATLTLLVCLSMIIAVPITGARIVLSTGIFASAFLVALSWYLRINHRILIDVSFPLLSSIAVFWLLVLVNYFHEEGRRVSIRGAFSRYVARELVEKLANEPDSLVLGGESKEITILFTDIRQFTKISEAYKNDPQGLTSLINRFLTPMSATIHARQGTIDKYMGDAIMAFWNAPADVPEHHTNACRAALEMLERLSALNIELRAEAGDEEDRYRPLRAGIGINTGLCVVGNLGSDLRFDYSALGDPVNLASRIEGLTKQYGLSILIGEETARAAARFALLEVDLIRVLGKAHPERIYVLLGDERRAERDDFRQLAAKHEAMLGAYRDRRWHAALAALEEERRLAPDDMDIDGLLDVYARRLKAYGADPPGADWDGVEEAKEK